ncbi:MAG: 4a-hydroxytetrahydrobiopterin dehydratase [Candidatus Aenigmarchaeota archaeon]|nr:4a-hydroxytetrahydrobiopterin dehydratase [Candidatus Aenigmarchaeota archaeon]
MMLEQKEIQHRLSELDGWRLEGNMITRQFVFHDFREAMKFANKTAEIAEENDHHPDMLISYNKVELSLTTHDEGGLTEMDFDMAEKIDRLKKA